MNNIIRISRDGGRHYQEKRATFVRLAPSMYNLIPAANSTARTVVEDGFEFSAIGRSPVAGGSFFRDRETALRNVHPEDKEKLLALIK